MACGLTRATLGRLPTYLAHVRELREQGVPNTSATAIARALGLGEVQVRKDLSAISGAGKPKTGYQVEELIAAMEDRLGYRKKRSAILLGAGKLGQALLDYDGFDAYGVHLLAAFDSDPAKLGVTDSGKPIYPLSELDDFVREHPALIGILTVPQGAAQEALDRLAQSGVKAVWSFAARPLRIPEGVWYQQENLALSLACLNGQLDTTPNNMKE